MNISLKKTISSIKNWIAKYSNELLLSGVWIISILIVYPWGEFPLNDDWAYSLDVFHLSQEGKLILNDWPGMTLIAQILWGGLISFVFGFSFINLRISTLVLGLITILAFYRILVLSGKNMKTSLLGSFLLIFSPLFFYSSFTFMTEIYFLITILFSFLYFYKFYSTEKYKYLFLSSFFVLTATLIRQPGILLGIAFTVSFLLIKPFSKRWVLISLTPTFFALSAHLIYSYWVNHNYIMPNYSNASILFKQLANTHLDFYYHRFGIIALYFGLFTLPVSAILLPQIISQYKWKEKAIIVLLTIIALVTGLLNDFPNGNVIYNLGLGPKLLKDAYWGENIHPILSNQIMYLIKILSLISASIVVTHFCKEAIKDINKIIKAQCSPACLLRVTFIVFFLLYVCFILINPIFFDRYLLPIIPAVALIILPAKPILSKKRESVFGLIMLVYVLFCITATHDYFSWNRARWKAANYLTEVLKVGKNKIDGGFEYNAWFQTGGCNPDVKNRISWWFVSSDDYVISFGNIPGFKKIGKLDYRRMLPPGIDSICILSRQDSIFEITYPIVCNCETKSSDNLFFLTENANIDFTGGAQQSNTKSLSGNYSILVDEKKPYGLLSKYANVCAGDKYIVKVWRKDSDDKAGIVISTEPGNNLYYFNNKAIEKNKDGWEMIVSEIVIPKNCDGLKLGIYVWNPGKNPVWFDDLEISKIQKTDGKKGL
jgi:hypothetical protein